ncbi:hypothetical protein QE364_000010 [Nocardioides zeae]|uniref:Uncharacterized protein n=1 Tax=Nocardioides zeae TaxID=1457234 RepID=A0ACC6IC81_9ACTN|nr:hypothetical protein [Nocardioides zeae]MDR6175389.1 hypothetical protein [Nocardioides zeae]MDR6208322.1 hypothetical protein [Nocardioides zeae]
MGRRWWRPYVAPAFFASIFIGLFVAGFLVDVSRSEQVVGQVLSAGLVGLMAVFFLTARGRRAARRASARSREPVTVGDQWRIFFGILATLTAMNVSDSLDLHYWTSMSVALPTCVGVVVAVSWVLGRARGPRAQRSN